MLRKCCECFGNLAALAASAGVHTSSYLLDPPQSPMGVKGAAIYGTLTLLISRQVRKGVYWIANVEGADSHALIDLFSIFASAASSWAITNQILGDNHQISYRESLSISTISGGLAVAIIFPSLYIVRKMRCREQ
jgi:L-fucose isomerase-like protein